MSGFLSHKSVQKPDKHRGICCTRDRFVFGGDSDKFEDHCGCQRQVEPHSTHGINPHHALSHSCESLLGQEGDGGGRGMGAG